MSAFDFRGLSHFRVWSSAQRLRRSVLLLAFASLLAPQPLGAVQFQAPPPDDPDPQCWRTAFRSFQAGGHFTPALTFSPRPSGRTVALDYRMQLADVGVGGVTVRNVPVAAITPTTGEAWLYYYGPHGARRCVVPGSAFATKEFVDLWKYAPIRLQLQGRDRLRYNVSSNIDYKKAQIATDSIPRKAPYGGVACDQTNVHTHGLLVPPTRPANPATGLFGDYVLTTTQPATSTADACQPFDGGAPDGHAGHDTTALMRHRIVLPQTPTAAFPDWRKMSPGAPSVHPTGLYFFHPHPHGYSSTQLSGATSGMITIGALGGKGLLSTPPGAPAQNVRHMLLKDMQVKPAGPGVFDFLANADPGLCDGASSLLTNHGYCANADGRRWYFTVNGQAYPLIDDIRAGEQEVWRLVNASPTVTYRLSVGRIDAQGKPIEAEKLDLQLLSVDGAAAQIADPKQQKFPRNILLMPGARVEFAINPPKGDGEYQLLSDQVETGGGNGVADTWQPVALARVRWPASTVAEAAAGADATARETTAGGKSMAARYANFARVEVKGPDLTKQTPANPHPYPAIGACRDLTDHKHERVIHFVKNPNQNVGKKDLFGLITGIRPAGVIDPSSAQTVYLRHKQGDALDKQTPFASWSALQAFNAPTSAFTPAFGQPEDASSICAVLQRDERHSEIWVLENWSNEIHNFHMHQTKFQIFQNSAAAYRNIPCQTAKTCTDTDNLLSVFYEDTSASAHDTVPVPRGVGANCDGTIRKAGEGCDPGRVTIEVRFGRPELIGQNGYGDFVFHCHILEHEDNGMMGLVRVVDPAVYRASMKAAHVKPDALHRH